MANFAPREMFKKSKVQSARPKEDAAKQEMIQQAERYDTERAAGRAPLEQIAQTTIPGVSAAPVDPTFRNSQLALLDQLTKQSLGQGPSLAQMQFQQAGNTALQKAMGAIRAATGANAALGGRTAALASTNLLGNLAAESGMARLREQQDAQSALAALAGAGRTGDLQARQQDIGLGATNAEIALKNAAARQQAAEGLLSNTGQRFEGYYNRGAQVESAKRAPKANSGVLPAIIGTAGAVLGGMVGGPAGAVAGNKTGNIMAGESNADVSGLSLTGQAPAAQAQTPSKRFSNGPFMKLRR